MESLKKVENFWKKLCLLFGGAGWSLYYVKKYLKHA